MKPFRPLTIGRKNLNYIEGLTKQHEAKLNQIGIYNIGQLRAFTEGRDLALISEITGINHNLFIQWLDWINEHWYAPLNEAGILGIVFGIISGFLQLKEWPAAIRTIRLVLSGADISKPTVRLPSKPFAFATVFYAVLFSLFILVPNKITQAYPFMVNEFMFLFITYSLLISEAFGIWVASVIMKSSVSYGRVFEVLLYSSAPLFLLTFARPLIKYTVKTYLPVSMHIYIYLLAFGVALHLFYLMLKNIGGLLHVRGIKIIAVALIAVVVIFVAELALSLLMGMGILVLQRTQVARRDTTFEAEDYGYSIRVPKGWSIITRKDLKGQESPLEYYRRRQFMIPIMEESKSAVAILWSESYPSRPVVVVNSYKLEYEDREFRKIMRRDAVLWKDRGLKLETFEEPEGNRPYYKFQGYLIGRDEEIGWTVRCQVVYRRVGSRWFGFVVFLGNRGNGGVGKDLEKMVMSVNLL